MGNSGSEQGSAEGGKRRPDVGAELPRIDFPTFVLSLSTTALYQMGRIPDPSTGQKIEPNVDLARQTIDTLEMLRAKTLGNLEPDEKQLIDSLLYELRVNFVELGK